MTSIALGMPGIRQSGSPASAFTWFDVATDPAGWETLASRTVSGMFHRQPLLKAHAYGNGRPVGIVLQREGGPPVALGAVLRETPRRSLQLLSFPALAATADPELACRLVDWLRMEGIAEVRIGSFTSGAEGYRRPPAATIQERLEFVWDLGGGTEQRFRALGSGHRRNLRKLLQRDLAIRKIGSWPAERMAWLHVAWARRRGQELPLAQLLQLYRYYRTLDRTLTRSGIGHLYGLYDRAGTLLSHAYMLECDGMAFYMIGASSPAGYRLNASLRLFWELGELYVRRGFGVLHFGGVPADAISKNHDEYGLFRFKTGFGIEPVSRISLSIKNEE